MSSTIGIVVHSLIVNRYSSMRFEHISRYEHHLQYRLLLDALLERSLLNHPILSSPNASPASPASSFFFLGGSGTPLAAAASAFQKTKRESADIHRGKWVHKGVSHMGNVRSIRESEV